MPLTKEKVNGMADSGTRYGRINEMRMLEAKGKRQSLAAKAEQYGFLEMAAEELFPII